jgi:hypothetical protein
VFAVIPADLTPTPSSAAWRCCQELAAISGVPLAQSDLGIAPTPGLHPTSLKRYNLATCWLVFLPNTSDLRIAWH